MEDQVNLSRQRIETMTTESTGDHGGPRVTTVPNVLMRHQCYVVPVGHHATSFLRDHHATAVPIGHCATAVLRGHRFKAVPRGRGTSAVPRGHRSTAVSRGHRTGAVPKSLTDCCLSISSCALHVMNVIVL